MPQSPPRGPRADRAAAHRSAAFTPRSGRAVLRSQVHDRLIRARWHNQNRAMDLNRFGPGTPLSP